MSNIELGVAIAGPGMIGAVHARAVRMAGAHLRGVAAASPIAGVEAARRFGAARGYDSFDHLIADPSVDVVHVCTPNSSHRDLALAALEAGKHVICEKPLATKASDARLLADTARRTGCVATVPFVYRFHPMVREARARVSALGRLQLIHGSYLQDWLLGADDTNWRVDATVGGASRAFADIGSHWCDLIEWVTGERLSSVVASFDTTVAQRPDQERQSCASCGTAEGHAGGSIAVKTEDVAAATFKTGSGVLVNVTVSQVSAGRKNRLWFEIDGANGSVVFDQEDPERLWFAREGRTELLVRDPNVGSPEQRRLATLPAGHAQGYAQCFEAFVADTYATIRGEQRDGLPTFDDGLRSAQIVEAVLESSRTNSWISINGGHQ
ncbi:Gfo/Idh/MocA family protein [Paraburkholderia tuberum]|uniref:Predicted dehydrogenase n=1 Tax=Paraburkholderia tuberum TaxID=157910 RepID=A0A1H1KH99_9BURK|nr:Gfo/Idh/MocA family oxidoreductase [Paraburkholderia tuberum]SDR61417.1 Predicted dehydrogenase [Paraburkholderia tuberum]